MAFPPATPVVDGTTIGNAAWWNAFLAELTSALQNAGTPTLTPAQVTAEMVAARGNLASLSARLASVVDSDGNALGQVLPYMLRNGFVHGNILWNDTFMMWSRGPSAAPDGWTLSGTGAAVAQCGSGMTDTQVLNAMDHFSARLTYGSAPAILTQTPITITMASANMNQGIINPELPVDSSGNTLPGYTVDGFSAYLIGHVFCNGTNRARLRIGSGTPQYSEYHPGDSGWHSLIAGPLAWSVSEGSVPAQCRVEAAGTAYFQALCVILVPAGIKPMYVPARVRYRTAFLPYVDNPATGILGYIPFARPGYVLGAQMFCTTAPGGTQPTVDLLTPISGTFQSMFATLPTITAAQLTGTLQGATTVEANIRRRTIRGAYAAAAGLSDNSIMRVDYVDDGSATLRGLTACIHYLEYDRPFDQFRAMTELGE